MARGHGTAVGTSALVPVDEACRTRVTKMRLADGCWPEASAQRDGASEHSVWYR